MWIIYDHFIQKIWQGVHKLEQYHSMIDETATPSWKQVGFYWSQNLDRGAIHGELPDAVNQNSWIFQINTAKSSLYLISTTFSCALSILWWVYKWKRNRNRNVIDLSMAKEENEMELRIQQLC